MKIKSVYIHGFGKFIEKEFIFPDGFFIICGENEAGKTTLLSFIKAMLYGLPTLQRRDISKNHRLKYRPWTGTGFGGRIHIEKDNNEYIIQRQFGESVSDDRIDFFTLHSGRQIEIGQMEPGEYLTGLNKIEFTNSIFMAQNSLHIKESKNLQEKIIKTATGQDIESSAKALKENLIEYDKALENPRAKKTTILSGLLSKKDNLENQLKEISEIDSVRRDLNKDLIDFKEEKTNILKGINKYEIAKERIDLEELLFKLKEKEELEELWKKSYEERISPVVLKRTEELIREIQFHEEGLSILKNDRNYLIFFISIILLIIGIISKKYIPLFLLSFVFLLLFFRDTNQRKKKAYNEKKISLEKELKELLNGIDNPMNFLEIAKEKENEFQMLSMKLDSINGDLPDSLKSSEIINELNNLPEYVYDEEKLKDLNQRYHIILEKEHFTRGQLESLKIDTIPAHLEWEIKKIDKKIEAIRFEQKALSISIDIVEKAMEDIREDFGAIANQSIEYYLKKITGDKLKLNLNKDFKIQIEDKYTGLQKSQDYLSTGKIDQIYLAIRLGLSETLYNESLPLCLDDISAHYDKRTFENTIDLLKNMGNHRQIFYISCQDIPGEKIKI